MLVPLNKGTAAMLLSPTNPLGIGLCSYANSFFCFALKTCSMITWVKTLYTSIFTYLLLGCFIVISTTEKTLSPHVKNHDNFSRVFKIANQLLARHSLYLACSTRYLTQLLNTRREIPYLRAPMILHNSTYIYIYICIYLSISVSIYLSIYLDR